MYRYLVRHFDYKFSLKKLRESKSTVHWITIAACFPPMAIAFSFGHLLPLFGSKQRAYYSRYRNQTNLYYRLLNQLRSPLTISHPGIPTVILSLWSVCLCFSCLSALRFAHRWRFNAWTRRLSLLPALQPASPF
ncbi:hypothetical protein GGU10DRAFT_86457 [Lentinula aff. detonsa]|uniref:Uncharacterized protein n=1 Tax=Lentinula aff. detonsa TaxID=2804958 RepID=A0AA38KUI7_9AGAR|nr:hypothetical protein GGU10DRAFT_86457 [Lentinula aff. detonsa]